MKGLKKFTVKLVLPVLIVLFICPVMPLHAETAPAQNPPAADNAGIAEPNSVQAPGDVNLPKPPPEEFADLGNSTGLKPVMDEATSTSEESLYGDKKEADEKSKFPYKIQDWRKLKDGTKVLLFFKEGKDIKDAKDREDMTNWLIIVVKPDGTTQIGTISNIVSTRGDMTFTTKIDGKDVEFKLQLGVLINYNGEITKEFEMTQEELDKILEAAKVKIGEIKSMGGYVYLNFTKTGDPTTFVIRAPLPKGSEIGSIKTETVKDEPLGTIKITVTIKGADGKEKINDIYYVDPLTGVLTQTLDNGEVVLDVTNLLQISPPK